MLEPRLLDISSRKFRQKLMEPLDFFMFNYVSGFGARCGASTRDKIANDLHAFSTSYLYWTLLLTAGTFWCIITFFPRYEGVHHSRTYKIKLLLASLCSTLWATGCKNAKCSNNFKSVTSNLNSLSVCPPLWHQPTADERRGSRPHSMVRSFTMPSSQRPLSVASVTSISSDNSPSRPGSDG